METEKDTKLAAGFGPGKALRQARLDLRLSPEDVATQLHLAPRQIMALEEDDYNALPQATYVRGYLRSYALLLGLTPEPILEAYGRMHVAAKPTITRERTTHEDHQEGQVRVATYVVGALVLVLIIAWWQGSNRDEFITPPSTPAIPPATEAPPADAANRNAPALVPTPGTLAGPTSPNVNTVPAPNPALAKSEPTAKPTRPPDAAAPLRADRTLQAPPSEGDQPRARLVFNAEQDSWVDVRDARDNRLLYETIPAGRIVALEGVPPFNVFLGNVDGVAVYIDGKAYDARRYKRGTTARFSIGAGAAHAVKPPRANPAPKSVAPAVTAPTPAPASTPNTESPPAATPPTLSTPTPVPTTPVPATPEAASPAPASPQ